MAPAGSWAVAAGEAASGSVRWSNSRVALWPSGSGMFDAESIIRCDRRSRTNRQQKVMHPASIHDASVAW